jgi:uracil phosphoribosyltransferase
MITTLTHPLAAHLVTRLRDRNTPGDAFRRHAFQLTSLLVLEATRDLPLAEDVVETPLEWHAGRKLSEALAVVPILRAGLAMLEPVVQLFPKVDVGYVGLERSHDGEASARRYYSKLPALAGKRVLVLDPMLATGGSAAHAVSLIREQEGIAGITMVCVVAAPEGVARLREAHPDVRIVTAALDRGLNERKYIVPGLGDFGDRLYGT